MTASERRLLVLLAAVAVAASLALPALSLSMDARQLAAAERAFAAAPSPAPSTPDDRTASSRERPAAMEPEAVAEALKVAGLKAGLSVDRYAIARQDGDATLELAVSGSAASMAGFLDATRVAAQGYRVGRLAIRKVESRSAPTRLEASLAFEISDSAALPESVGSGEEFARLMGLPVASPRILPAPAPPPAAPAPEASAPPRRLAYVGTVATETGSEYFIKDLDSGRVVRLGAFSSSADSWRLAGRDGDILLLEIEGRSYRISTK